MDDSSSWVEIAQNCTGMQVVAWDGYSGTGRVLDTINIGAFTGSHTACRHAAYQAGSCIISYDQYIFVSVQELGKDSRWFACEQLNIQNSAALATCPTALKASTINVQCAGMRADSTAQCCTCHLVFANLL